MRPLTIPSISRKATLSLGLLATAVLWLSMAPLAAATPSITIYQNKLRSIEQRSQVNKYSGGRSNCARSSSKAAIKFRLGKRTKECAYLVPAIGRDLEVTATGRLFKSTPKAVKKNAYLAVNLRQAKDGSRYQLAVYPSGRRYQIRKLLEGGKVEVLERGRSGNNIGGFGEANRMVLRAYNGVEGQPANSARLVASVNGNRVAVADDARGAELTGRDTTFSIASSKNATGAFGSFTGVRVRMPDPFG